MSVLRLAQLDREHLERIHPPRRLDGHRRDARGVSPSAAGVVAGLQVCGDFLLAKDVAGWLRIEAVGDGQFRVELADGVVTFRSLEGMLAAVREWADGFRDSASV
jgi:hypothetical protein